MRRKQMTKINSRGIIFTMNRQHHITPKQALHTARLVASFALLGAVMAGSAFGWLDIDLRPYGAVIGGSAAFIYKLIHLA